MSAPVTRDADVLADAMHDLKIFPALSPMRDCLARDHTEKPSLSPVRPRRGDQWVPKWSLSRAT